MSDGHSQHQHYLLVSRAIGFLLQHRSRQPSLTELAASMNLSESHAQRVFTEWAGVSPKQFLQYLTKEHAKQLLRNSSVLQTALDSGLSGTSRLHDLMITHESVTPGEYRRRGQDLHIDYGSYESQFGYCFLAVTHRGLCKLAFFDDSEQRQLLIEELRNEWPLASMGENRAATDSFFSAIFSDSSKPGRSIHLLLAGSPFRLKVWEALLKIPFGEVRSYQQLAASIGKPTSSRAVASAIASNAIGLLVPCHRVIRNSGAISQYRWGETRKASLIGWEQSILNDVAR